MATRRKENGGVGERRGSAAPLQAAQTGTKSRFSHPKTRVPAGNEEKQVPNYLKPTISSGKHEQGKKPLPSDKPNLSRRRSFDKPFSPNTTLRSPHSVSSKTKAVQKSIPEKTKPKPPNEDNKSKKSSMCVEKQGSESNAAIPEEQVSCPGENPDTCEALETGHPETKSNDQELALTQPQDDIIQFESSIPETCTQVEASQDENSNEMGTEVLGSVELDQSEANSDNFVPQQEDTALLVKEEEPQEQIEEDTLSKDMKSEEYVLIETNSSTIEDKERALESTPSIGKSEAHEDSKEVKQEAESRAPKGNKDSAVSNGVKQEAESRAPKGNKDSAVSNGVIEETASKLREQRKNKVKALAGAFETVISLQDHK